MIVHVKMEMVKVNAADAIVFGVIKMPVYVNFMGSHLTPFFNLNYQENAIKQEDEILLLANAVFVKPMESNTKYKITCLIFSFSL